jgi:hypothetical protein
LRSSCSNLQLMILQQDTGAVDLVEDSVVGTR